MNDDLTLLSAKIRANSRVDLYDKNYLYRIKWTTPILLLISLILLTVFFYTDVLNQTQLIISSLIVFTVVLIVQLLSRRVRIATIKGDSIILKDIHAKSTVTSIKSIRRASSFYFFGVPVTQLVYTLDHQRKKSLVFGAPSDITFPIDKVIALAKKCKK